MYRVYQKNLDQLHSANQYVVVIFKKIYSLLMKARHQSHHLETYMGDLVGACELIAQIGDILAKNTNPIKDVSVPYQTVGEFWNTFCTNLIFLIHRLIRQFNQEEFDEIISVLDKIIEGFKRQDMLG